MAKMVDLQRELQERLMEYLNLPPAEVVAERMAREMYPHKFSNPNGSPHVWSFTEKPAPMISAEDFDKQMAKLARDLTAVADAGDCVADPASSAAAASPLSRLFAAVRDVLKHEAAQFSDPEFIELHSAYDSLGLKDE